MPWQGSWRRGASSLGRLGLCAALMGGWLPGASLLSAGLSAAGVLAGVQAAPPALAQGAGLPSAEAVADVARGITVRIEGATQGSGVLVQREGDIYTVLTAWHVVSGQRPGEELAVYTPDGREHAVLAGSIQRIGAVDLAVLRFRSSTVYAVAQLAPLATAPMGSLVYVAGFPHPSSAVPRRLLRFLEGRVVADAGADIPNGYQLLYDNRTLPGMSGGAVLNGRGQLVAIHGQGETEVRLTEQADVAVKSGTNQGVPVAFWREPGGTAATRESVRPLRSSQVSRGVEETPSPQEALPGEAQASQKVAGSPSRDKTDPISSSPETGDSIHSDSAIAASSGLLITDLVVGDGAEALSYKLISVHYRGSLGNGMEFDSSHGRDPFKFQLGAGRVIKGWDEGLIGMRVGGKRRLVIPPEMAYGDRGAGGVIPPNATLIFEVELLDVH